MNIQCLTNHWGYSITIPIDTDTEEKQMLDKITPQYGDNYLKATFDLKIAAWFDQHDSKAHWDRSAAMGGFYAKARLNPSDQMAIAIEAYEYEEKFQQQIKTGSK